MFDNCFMSFNIMRFSQGMYFFLAFVRRKFVYSGHLYTFAYL